MRHTEQGHLDMGMTAAQIEADIYCIEQHLIDLAKKDKAKIWVNIKEHFLGLADWCQEQQQTQDAQKQQFTNNLKKLPTTPKS